MRTRLTIASMLLLVVLLAGCRTAPIYNVESSPVPASANLTRKQVGNVIEREATVLGWHVERQAPGRMVATLELRRHVAVVDILYDDKQFSIHYKDSKVLNYDGKKIHRNYNNWIHNLQRRITAGCLEG